MTELEEVIEKIFDEHYTDGYVNIGMEAYISILAKAIEEAGYKNCGDCLWKFQGRNTPIPCSREKPLDAVSDNKGKIDIKEDSGRHIHKWIELKQITKHHTRFGAPREYLCENCGARKTEPC